MDRVFRGREQADVGFDDPLEHPGDPGKDHRGEGEHDQRGQEERRNAREGRGRQPLLGGEPAPEEARGVGEGHDGAEHHAGQQQHARGSVARRVLQQCLVDGFLGDEAEKRRQPGHRGGGERRDAEEHRGTFVEPGELVQVAGSGLVVDDADHQEERGLEEAVRQHHGHARQRRVRAAQAHDEDQEAELGDGSVGQHQLQVMLPQCAPAADQQRRKAQAQQHRLPEGRLAEARGEPRDEVDAGLDHRRGVQVGGDGSRCRHGPGKPEVEGHQCRLGDGTDKDQQDRHVDERAAGHELGGQGHDLGDPVGPGGLAEHDQAHEHCQPAEGRDDQRCQCRAPGAHACAVETDQQVGQDRCQFPEDEHQDHVIRCDKPEHGPGEGQQLGAEGADVRVFALEVPGAVEQHQGPDAEHQQAEDRGERVHPEVEVCLQGPDPRVEFGGRCVGKPAGRRLFRAREGREIGHEPGEGHGGDGCQDVER